MFRKKKNEVPAPKPVVVEKPPRPLWKKCSDCKKCVISEKSGLAAGCGGYGIIDTKLKCSDTDSYILSFYGWDVCDGFEPKHGCSTCNKVKYCKIGCMNKVYADRKINCIKQDDCPEWVILTEIDSMIKHEGE